MISHLENAGNEFGMAQGSLNRVSANIGKAKSNNKSLGKSLRKMSLRKMTTRSRKYSPSILEPDRLQNNEYQLFKSELIRMLKGYTESMDNNFYSYDAKIFLVQQAMEDVLKKLKNIDIIKAQQYFIRVLMDINYDGMVDDDEKAVQWTKAIIQAASNIESRNIQSKKSSYKNPMKNFINRMFNRSARGIRKSHRKKSKRRKSKRTKRYRAKRRKSNKKKKYSKSKIIKKIKITKKLYK